MHVPPFPYRNALLASLLLGGLSVAPVHALTLGELRTQSFLGQPLHVTVVYRKSAEANPPEPRCLTLLPAENDLPTPGRVQLSVREQDNTIEIFSVGAISEPMIGFILQSTCDGQSFSRSYTAFIDPEPAVAPPIVAQQTVTEPAPAPAPDIRPESPPATVKPVPLSRWPNRIVAKEAASIKDLASAYYPPESKRYKRLVKALIATNPGLTSEEDLIPAGTRLRTSQPAPAKPKPAPKTISGGEDRLTLVAEDPATRRAVPSQPKNREEQLQSLQSKVSTLQELQLKMETEIKQLQHSLVTLASAPAIAPAIQASTPAILVASTPAPVQVASTSMTASQPAQASMAVATVSSNNNRLASIPFWAWLTGGLLCVGGFSFWLGRHARQASGYSIHRNLPPKKPEPVGLNVFNTQFGIPREPVSDTSIMHNPASGIEVEEDESDIDRAQFLLAEGEVEEAIALLYKTIDENERDIERWLILFHVFRERMMKTEYAQLALRFRELPPDEEDWDLVSNIGRKIDPDNKLYVHNRPAAIEPPKDEAQLDFLVSAAKAAVIEPPAKIDLGLPSLEPAEPFSATNQESAAIDTTTEEKDPPSEQDDDFSKPCRY